jgi:hypothetical protein
MALLARWLARHATALEDEPDKTDSEKKHAPYDAIDDASHGDAYGKAVLRRKSGTGSHESDEEADEERLEAGT